MSGNKTFPSSPAELAIRGLEVTGLDIYKRMPEETTAERGQQLMSEIHADMPTGGVDLKYGQQESQHLRFWSGTSRNPLVLYVHGGSWQAGTNLDSIGSAKVQFLTQKGYAVATVNYTLVPKITVKKQVQEVAASLKYLISNAKQLSFDPNRIILMGHSSGAHVATLLGTDESYLEKVNLEMNILKGIVALDGSNYNALAELIDSPGSIANNMLHGLGKDPDHLRNMSPVYHVRGSIAGAFLCLHAQRHGDIRQALEFCACLEAVNTRANLHVFEGEFFEGHVRILLRLGQEDYPATQVLGAWLESLHSLGSV